ncbi:MAG TPA: 2-amino-4-hydroxy-6-hydroxymethyldihydropteridine diphosphokinase [Sulfuriferula sp.]|nr:2-amino-4-hydroxy-6-hydroxymethyldihydropteridine diphosphokinase [Sulfuriferula sp.]
MNPCTPTMLPARAFVALGSNLADPAGQVLAALDAIAALPHTRLLARSSLYLNAPVGYADQPDFINAVAQIETSLTPHQLLDALLNIEHAFGRERTFRNAPRVIDLDVLSYAALQCHDAGLTLPHPRMHERAFVLVPLLEIAPDMVIPGLQSAAHYLPGVAGHGLTRVADSWTQQTRTAEKR